MKKKVINGYDVNNGFYGIEILISVLLERTKIDFSISDKFLKTNLIQEKLKAHSPSNKISFFIFRQFLLILE
tara:strand:+ start:359 stop:574 length:216 start_codon:yes stop_codon:yes gene_type:complete